jgi:hypothetical protein
MAAPAEPRTGDHRSPEAHYGSSPGLAIDGPDFVATFAAPSDAVVTGRLVARAGSDG